MRHQLVQVTNSSTLISDFGMRFKTWWLHTIIISNLGHAEASVLQHVVLTDDVIPLQRFLHLSSDGPNVNKSLFKSLDEEVKSSRSGHADDVGLLNIGTCNLHVVHNAFWQWHE
jgi:hypothetical protein